VQAQAQAQAPTAAFTVAGSTFEGRASWYGAAFQGRRTANGEVFDKEGLTAAHRSLPFGTLLRVTDRSSGASVIVRVNDRGPFVGDRILDLSEAAARLIGLVPEGTGWVSCLVLGPEEAAAFGAVGPAPGDPAGAGLSTSDPTTSKGASAAPTPAVTQPAARSCRIQVASFASQANADATLQRLRLSGIDAVLEQSGIYRRVVLPSVPEGSLPVLMERLGALGYRDLLIKWLP
jgi:rare lipoprotein A